MAARPSLIDAMRVVRDGDALVGHIHPDFTVFGNPHGGYLAGVAANAALAGSGLPDIFTITTHYLRRPELGDLRLRVETVGGSRRFTTVAVAAEQEGAVVFRSQVSLGDRASVAGPSWRRAPFTPIPHERRSPLAEELAATPGVFGPPDIGQRAKLRLDMATVGFMTGTSAERGLIRAVMDITEVDQAVLVLASDITPPAVWNVLGVGGWTPTLELTVHLRGRPVGGPLHVDAETSYVGDGLLEEDSLVHSDDGTLLAQGRQLALLSRAAPS